MTLQSSFPNLDAMEKLISNGITVAFLSVTLRWFVFCYWRFHSWFLIRTSISSSFSSEQLAQMVSMAIFSNLHIFIQKLPSLKSHILLQLSIRTEAWRSSLIRARRPYTYALTTGITSLATREQYLRILYLILCIPGFWRIFYSLMWWKQIKHVEYVLACSTSPPFIFLPDAWTSTSLEQHLLQTSQCKQIR